MSPFTDLRKSHPNERLFDQPPLAMDAEGLARDFQHYYAHTLGRDRDCRSAYYFVPRLGRSHARPPHGALEKHPPRA